MGRDMALAGLAAGKSAAGGVRVRVATLQPMRHIMASACGLLLLTVATPANACSPPQTREWTRAEVIEAARLDHAKAQFVADVHVLGWTGEGRLVLGVERQFKGTKRASLVLVPSGCGDLIPPVGRRARLLVRSLDGAKGADLQVWSRRRSWTMTRSACSSGRSTG
jgi:hypothetical protein